MSKAINSIADIARYIKRGDGQLKPCRSWEVDDIEKEYGITLPQAYKDFLLLMGKKAGRFMVGSSVFYDELFFLKSWANELGTENDLPPLLDDAFPFWMHQGYMVAYFITTEGDDPPVYSFAEGKDHKGYVLDSMSVTEFFLKKLLISFPEDRSFLLEHVGKEESTTPGSKENLQAAKENVIIRWLRRLFKLY